MEEKGVLIFGEASPITIRSLPLAQFRIIQSEACWVLKKDAKSVEIDRNLRSICGDPCCNVWGGGPSWLSCHPARFSGVLARRES